VTDLHPNDFQNALRVQSPWAVERLVPTVKSDPCHLTLNCSVLK